MNFFFYKGVTFDTIEILRHGNDFIGEKKTCSFERARNLQTMIKETDHGNNLFIITSKYAWPMHAKIFVNLEK